MVTLAVWPSPLMSYVRLVLHARRGVVDPISRACPYVDGQTALGRGADVYIFYAEPFHYFAFWKKQVIRNTSVYSCTD